MNVISVGQVGVAVVDQLREEPLDVGLGAVQHGPDPAHGVLEVVEVALVGGDRALPVPLVDVGAVVVVEEVVLAHGPHVGAQPLARAHAELPQGHALPLRRGLHDLCVDRVHAVVVGDVELRPGCASRRGRACR